MTEILNVKFCTETPADARAGRKRRRRKLVNVIPRDNLKGGSGSACRRKEGMTAQELNTRYIVGISYIKSRHP